MPLDSCKSDRDALSAYRENADYDLSTGTSKAYAFLAAIRILLLRPRRARAGGVSGEEVEVSHDSLIAARDECKAWLSRKRISTSPAFGYLDTGCIDQ